MSVKHLREFIIPKSAKTVKNPNKGHIKFVTVEVELFARCSLLFARCSLVFTRFSLLFARCSLLFACCLLISARCSLLFARCLLLFALCSLLFTGCLRRNSEKHFLSKSKQKVLHITLYKKFNL